MSVKESHELCDVIEKELEKVLTNTSVLIHIEPAKEAAASAAAPRSGRRGRARGGS